MTFIPLLTKQFKRGAPTSPYTGQLGWYDASDTASITHSGGNVTQWNDKSGNARHLTPAGTGPTTNSRTINSKNVLDFVGGVARTLQSAIFTRAQPVTYYVVFQSDIAPGTAAVNGQLLRDTTGNQPSVGAYSAGVLTRRWMAYAGTTLISSTDIDNSAHVLCVVYNGASSLIYLDNVQIASGNVGAGGISAARFVVGDTGTYDGAIGEVITYAAAHGATERSYNASYLKSKWGTP